MTEKFKESIDKGNAFGALLTYQKLLIALITLLIAKLFAFGVSPLSLKLTHFYLSNQAQRIKINNNFSDRTIIEFGVSQGSVSGPLLITTEHKESSVTSYANDTTQHSCATDIASVSLELQTSAF